MNIKNFAFVAQCQRLMGTKIYSHKLCEPSILTLHGLSLTATRHGIRYLLDDLALKGYASMCFDFSGNGDSTGVLKNSSLNQRYEEALAAAKHLSKNEPPVLIGTSMGGHLAASVVPLLHPQTLILFCPAAYSENALKLKFDKNFERPGNYADSPAYVGIKEFKGDLLIVAAKNDDVVSTDVIEGYLAHAQHVRSKEVIWLDHCGHFIHRWLPFHQPEKNKVFSAILRILSLSSLYPLGGK